MIPTVSATGVGPSPPRGGLGAGLGTGGLWDGHGGGLRRGRVPGALDMVEIMVGNTRSIMMKIDV